MNQPAASYASGEHASSKLLARLFIELFQAEESALKRPRIEAEGLGDVAPGRALLAVSEHAARALQELHELADEEGLEASSGAKRLGDLFSVVRDALADRMLDREKSYRGTLIGVHHGVDLVTLLASAARAEGRGAVSSWCHRWLAERRPLVDRVAAELAWFAANPERALEGATEPTPAGR